MRASVIQVAFKKLKVSRNRSVGVLALASASVLCAAIPAGADFSGDYAIANWTLTTNGGDGSVVSFGSPVEVQLTGNNNGTSSIDTDFTITATGSGLVSFDWGYQSTDVGFFDSGGFLLNGVYTELADNSTQVAFYANPFSMAVNAGDVFGFRVSSVDGSFDPGTFGVTDFSAPSAAAAPEPSTLALLALGSMGGVLLARRKCSAGK